MKELTDYRTRIFLLGFDRRSIAEALDLSYSSFNYKLLRFGNFTPEQERGLCQILADAENAQQEKKE